MQRKDSIMEPYTGTARSSDECCWRCHRHLWHLEPLVQGSWQYYCPECQHLTVTRAEADRALHDMPAGAVGVVVAVPYPLRLVSPAPSQTP